MFGKIFGKKSKKSDKFIIENNQEPLTADGVANTIREKANIFSEFLFGKIGEAKSEIEVMRYKYSNLLETNYNLGLKHIENGNISDAIFRFKFIVKFWPNHYQSYFKLAYCLVIDKKEAKAIEVLEKLVAKNPNCDEEAKDLLKRLKTEEVQN